MTGKRFRSGGDHMPQKVQLGDGKSPTKPTDISESVSKKWDELIAKLPKMLTPIDGFELRILSQLLVQSDELEKQLAEEHEPAVGRLYLSVSKQIHSLSASFGLNPSDRAKLGLTVIQALEPDPFLEYLEQAKQARNN